MVQDKWRPRRSRYYELKDGDPEYCELKDGDSEYYELKDGDPEYPARFYDCCGAEDPSAPGCTTACHVSYDD
ncbi:unnamed protein product [Closterium sp. NIES-64]|nr:unnamed protein product [Closterium sp. NIES-64]